MAVKSSVDLGAFFGAAFLTVAVALFVAWSYSLDVTVLLRFPGLVYFVMFAAVIGMPTYYILKYTRAHHVKSS